MFFLNVSYIWLLNPHGSDETLYSPKYQIVLLRLLNPHGSDETVKEIPVWCEWNNFLTHTVQMKRCI